MEEKDLTGVEEQAPDAGGQEESFEEEDIFGSYEETDEDTADNEGEEETTEPEDEDDAKVDPKAFAAKLSKERERIERETEERLRREFEAKLKPQQTQSQSNEPQYKGDAPPPLRREDLDKLADDLGTTPETANAMYHQQWLLNKQAEETRRTREYLETMRDNNSKFEALRNLEKQRSSNPGLPEVDEQKLQQIRDDYRKQTGYSLPWEDAYEKLIAKEVMSGSLKRKAEQETIGKITARNKATIQAGKGGQAKRPSIDELPSDEFNRLVEEAKLGKYKKS